MNIQAKLQINDSGTLAKEHGIERLKPFKIFRLPHHYCSQTDLPIFPGLSFHLYPSLEGMSYSPVLSSWVSAHSSSSCVRFHMCLKCLSLGNSTPPSPLLYHHRHSSPTM